MTPLNTSMAEAQEAALTVLQNPDILQSIHKLTTGRSWLFLSWTCKTLNFLVWRLLKSLKFTCGGHPEDNMPDHKSLQSLEEILLRAPQITKLTVVNCFPTLSSFHTLTNLTDLTIDAITPVCPSILAPLTRIIHLGLAPCQFTDLDPFTDLSSQLESLEIGWLHDETSKGVTPEQFFASLLAFTKLKTLKIRDFDLVDSSFGHVASLTNLENLSLQSLGKYPTADGLNQISSLVKLTSLYLPHWEEAQLTLHGLYELTALTSLITHLYTSDYLLGLSNLTNLTDLKTDATTDPILDSLTSTLTRLRTWDLSYHYLSYPKTFYRLTNLQHLNLTCSRGLRCPDLPTSLLSLICPQSTGKGVSHLTNLTSLTLIALPLPNEIDVDAFQPLTALTALITPYLPWSEQAFKKIQHLTRLEILHVGYSSPVGCLFHQIPRLPRIKELRIGQGKGNDSHIRALKLFTRLETLILQSWSNSVDPETTSCTQSVSHLFDHLPHLETIELDDGTVGRHWKELGKNPGELQEAEILSIDFF